MIQIGGPSFDSREISSVQSILADGMVADGPEVRTFEEEFAAFCDANQAVAVANGTTALHAALECIGVGSGDQVVTTPFSFVASGNAIRLAGAVPVFADIDPETFNLDVEAVRKKLKTEEVDAILAVHLYGLPADMKALCDLADAHDIPVIEDASQAHGALYDGKPVGAIGDVGTFSFYPTKNMTTGEGGMIVTDNVEAAQRARSFINHGRTGNGTYEHQRLGTNYRMTSLAAAIGRVQLEKLPSWVDRRRENAETLTAGLSELPGIDPPTEPENYRHAYHQYTVRCHDQGELKQHLHDRGIQSRIYYPKPIHRLEAYEDIDISLPAAEAASNEVLSLPVHPDVTETDLSLILEAIEEYPFARA